MEEEMDLASARYFLEELFSKAGKPSKGYMDYEEHRKYLARDGSKRFKRKALGICGSRTFKTLDGIAKLLLKTKIASTNQEARQLVPQLVKATEIDPQGIEASIFDFRYLIFRRVENASGTDALYEIRIQSY